MNALEDLYEGNIAVRVHSGDQGNDLDHRLADAYWVDLDTLDLWTDEEADNYPFYMVARHSPTWSSVPELAGKTFQVVEYNDFIAMIDGIFEPEQDIDADVDDIL